MTSQEPADPTDGMTPRELAALVDRSGRRAAPKPTTDTAPDDDTDPRALAARVPRR